MVEARLANDTTVTAGHTYQKTRAKGGMWGALPMYYSDGTQTNYPISTSTSADWSRWNTETNSTFAELEHRFNADWSVKSTLTYTKANSNSQLFYVYGSPDRATGDGLFSYPSKYNSSNEQTLADISAKGRFTLGGRQHDVTFGASWSESKLHDGSLDLAVLYNPPQRPGLASELLAEEKLVMVTTRADGQMHADTYVYVDWGPSFAANHQATYPELSSPPVSISLGPLALVYLLEVGGASYFRIGSAQPYLDAGLLYRVRDAPEFSHSAYAVYAAQRDNPTLDRARACLREVAEKSK